MFATSDTGAMVHYGITALGIIEKAFGITAFGITAFRIRP